MTKKHLNDFSACVRVPGNSYVNTSRLQQCGPKGKKKKKKTVDRIIKGSKKVIMRSTFCLQTDKIHAPNKHFDFLSNSIILKMKSNSAGCFKIIYMKQKRPFPVFSSSQYPFDS